MNLVRTTFPSEETAFASCRRDVTGHLASKDGCMLDFVWIAKSPSNLTIQGAFFVPKTGLEPAPHC